MSHILFTPHTQVQVKSITHTSAAASLTRALLCITVISALTLTTPAYSARTRAEVQEQPTSWITRLWRRWTTKAGILNNLAATYQSEGKTLQAFECLEDAALSDPDQPFIALNLAKFYMSGIGTQQNDTKAFECLKAASDQRYVPEETLYQLGRCYEQGKGTEQDMKQAIACYKKIIAQRRSVPNPRSPMTLSNTPPEDFFVSALLSLASHYEKTTDLRQRDYKQAFEYYKIAASKHDPFALMFMGSCYTHGKGVQKDERKAFTAFQEAANLGYDNALVRVGSCYRYGHGVPQNMKTALNYFEQAAKAGSDSILKQVAPYVIDGDLPLSPQFISILYDHRNAIEDDATRLALKSRLRHCYHYGIGVEKNEKREHELDEELAKVCTSVEMAEQATALTNDHFGLVDGMTVGCAHENCSICDASFTSGAALSVLPCYHHFHTACIQRWQATQQAQEHEATCPNCRQAAPHFTMATAL